MQSSMSERKYTNKASDLDDEDFLTSPCFQIGAGVQLKDFPTSGEEYLLTVIKERQKCAVVTKCDKDFSKFAKNQSCFVQELPIAKVSDKLKPTLEWQNMQVADFSDMRMYISRILARKSSWPSDVQKIEIEQNNLIGWKNFFMKSDPTLSCVLGLRYTLIDRGLEMLTETLNEVKSGYTIEHKTGQWIYSFLACTRQPLLSETTSILRDLARKCAEIRSHIDPNDDNALLYVAPLNLFICLVGRYFRQYDLAD